ncbi:MAG: glycosyltransferase family 2 protein [Chloroflexi bacterium]|nr:glycosyltransferase family 2 protein [Chloroflexota bacterium]
MPTWTVVLPTYNRIEILEQTLKHLAEQRYPRDRFEVLAVDNSSQLVKAMVERIASETGARLFYLRDEHRLPAIKRNTGWQAGSGELILFMNDDAWAEPDLLLQHTAMHRSHAPNPIAVVGNVPQSPALPSTPFLEWFKPFSFWELRDGQRLTWMYCWSMNLSIPRRILVERHIAFHEDWKEIGQEDLELGYQLSRADIPIYYCAKAIAWHYHPHTLASASRVQREIGRGLHDLQRLVPEPGILERYGIFAWNQSPWRIAKGLVKRAIFNRATIPAVTRYLETCRENNWLTVHLYWKVMNYWTTTGYREAAPKRHRFPLLREVIR